jgi:hypothetical protein
MIHTGSDKDGSPHTGDNHTPSTSNQQDRDKKKQKKDNLMR